jgi:hypothetical protein
MSNLCIDTYGNKYWVNELGQYHLENGPAVEWVNGDKEWYLNGKLHRDDGPAIDYVNGRKEWFKHGKQYHEALPKNISYGEIIDNKINSPSIVLKNRAQTDHQKTDLICKLLSAWKKYPTLRLGQLIVSSIYKSKIDLFYIEDYNLIELIEKFGEND